MPDQSAAVLRQAVPADAEELARVQVQAWRESYRGMLSDGYLDALSLGPRLEFWHRVLADPQTRTWVVEEPAGPGGRARLGGFASTRRPDPDQPRDLELWGIYLLAARQRRGLGGRLWLAAVGERPCFLWVAGQNLSAQAFYRRYGMLPDGERRLLPWMEDLPVVRMVR